MNPDKCMFTRSQSLTGRLRLGFKLLQPKYEIRPTCKNPCNIIQESYDCAISAGDDRLTDEAGYVPSIKFTTHPGLVKLFCPDTRYITGAEVSQSPERLPSSVSPTSFRLWWHLVRVGLTSTFNEGL